jgi:hypothetical protein
MKSFLLLVALVLLSAGSGHADTVTAESPLGEIVVSCETLDARSFPFQGVKGATYVNKKYGFTITVPSEERWQFVESPRIPDALFDAPILILSTKIIDNHKASVSVFVDAVERNTSIMAYVESSVFQLRKSGRNIISLKLDDETSGAYVESSGKDNRTEVSSLQRFAARDGTAFVVTANSLPGEKTPPEMKNDLREIINSFQLLTDSSPPGADGNRK